MMKPVALVTGASRGIGSEIAKGLVEKGYEVYGTTRHPDSLPEEERTPGVKFLKMDLLDPDSIDRLISNFNALDLLVNNAGFSQIGPLEEASWDKIQEIFTGNFFSQVRMIKGFIPIMRKQKSGTIVNVTSMAGTKSNPYGTMYAATKAAFDRLSQGLRYELEEFNIRVITIAPLGIRTHISQTKAYNDDSPYLTGILNAKRVRDEKIAVAVHPKIVFKQLYRILKRKNPKDHHVVGRGRHIMALLMKHLPQKWVENLTKIVFQIRKPLRQ